MPGPNRAYAVLQLMAPILLGVGVAQISLLINAQIASHLAWQRDLALLCGPPDAISPPRCWVWRWAWCRRSSRPPRRQGMPATVFSHARLRSAHRGAAGCALRGGVCSFAGPLVPPCSLRQIDQRRCGADCPWRWLSYGAGLLGLVAIKVLAPGYYASQDIRTGEDRRGGAGHHAVAQPGAAGAADGARRAGIVDRPGR